MHRSKATHHPAPARKPDPPAPPKPQRPFWVRFPESCLQAGRDAYRLGVHIRNNPYRNNGKPFWELWEKGYKAERRLLEAHQEGDPYPAQLPPFTGTACTPDLQRFNRTLRTAAA